jgi:microcystin-dependent protein
MATDNKQFGATFIRTASSSPSLGQIITHVGDTMPDGWLPCDHRMLRRGMYPELFKVIGTKHGDGDGSNTAFNLPNIPSSESSIRSIVFVGKPR